MSRAASPAWFRRHFNRDYLVLYSGRSREQAREEAGFVVRELRVRPHDRVLDLCCGFGRHLEALRERGIRACGVDLSHELLTVARERLTADGPGAQPDLVCGDMLRLPFRGGPDGFSVLLSFFTSFGYFESDDDHRRAAAEMGRVLRPGGRFALDLMNPAATVRSLVPRSERSVDRLAIEEERRHDPVRSRIEKTIRVRDLRTGERREYLESVRLFEPAEIRGLLGRAGLEVETAYGDFHGAAFGPESPRMILVGRRPA